VINYDLPEKPENYVHRVGRTGRGVNKGIAISFCSSEEKPLLDEIQAFLNKPIEVLHVDKLDYAATLAPSSPDEVALKALVDDQDAWLSKKKKKKSKRKK